MELTRFDRNIADNLIDFSIFKEEETLVKNVIVYFAHDFQRGLSPENLFGKRTLDPAVFAKTMGYKNYRSLIKKHARPHQFDDLSKEQVEELKKKADSGEIALWDTLLCNALYKLFTIKMIFSRPGKTPNGTITDTLTELQLLKTITKFYHPVTGKIYYEYELQETFINNLARYFFKISVDVFAGLRKMGLQDFYIKLIAIRDRAKPQEGNNNISVDWLTFDALCEFADTHCSTPSDNKKYINNAVKKINSLTGETIVTVEWTKNGKFNFKPILHFNYSSKELETKKDESMKRFNHYMLFNLKKVFRELHPFLDSQTLFNQKLERWLIEESQHFEHKQKAFLDTYVQCFGKEINRHDNLVFNYVRHDIPKFSKLI